MKYCTDIVKLSEQPMAAVWYESETIVIRLGDGERLYITQQQDGEIEVLASTRHARRLLVQPRSGNTLRISVEKPRLEAS